MVNAARWASLGESNLLDPCGKITLGEKGRAGIRLRISPRINALDSLDSLYIDSQSFTTKCRVYARYCPVSTATLEAKCAFEKPGFFGRTNFCRFDNSALAKHGTIMSSLECKHVQTTNICSISAAGIASGLFGAWPPLWRERQFGDVNWRWMFDWSLSSISYSILLVTSGFGIKKNGPDAYWCGSKRYWHHGRYHSAGVGDWWGEISLPWAIRVIQTTMQIHADPCRLNGTLRRTCRTCQRTAPAALKNTVSNPVGLKNAFGCQLCSIGPQLLFDFCFRSLKLIRPDYNEQNTANHEPSLAEYHFDRILSRGTRELCDLSIESIGKKCRYN